jgi:hypothetical protein
MTSLVDALGDNEEDDDWLTALDVFNLITTDGTTTLGLTTTIAGKTRTSSSSLSQQQPLLDTRWHDDPRLRWDEHYWYCLFGGEAVWNDSNTRAGVGMTVLLRPLQQQQR